VKIIIRATALLAAVITGAVLIGSGTAHAGETARIAPAAVAHSNGFTWG